MANIISITIFILATIMPIIYDVFLLKKFRYSIFVVLVSIYLGLLLMFNDKSETGSLTVFIYGLPAVLLLYVFSFVCFIKTTLYLIKKLKPKI